MCCDKHRVVFSYYLTQLHLFNTIIFHCHPLPAHQNYCHFNNMRYSTCILNYKIFTHTYIVIRMVNFIKSIMHIILIFMLKYFFIKLL